MAGLTYHKTLSSPTDVAEGDTGASLRSKFNNNYDTLVDDAQDVEDRLEDVVYEMFSSGVLTGMSATIGTGLSIDVSSGTAMIGILVDYAGGCVSVPADQTDASLYFGQDGNFYTTPPSGVSYFTFCTYSSDSSDVTSVGTTTKVLPVSLVTITDTFEDVRVDSSHTRDYGIDHAGTATLIIPGFITSLSVSPSSAFSIEHIDMEDDTGSTFKVQVTRGDSYQSYSDYYVDGSEHGDYAYCDISFTRTGFAYG